MRLCNGAGMELELLQLLVRLALIVVAKYFTMIFLKTIFFLGIYSEYFDKYSDFSIFAV